MTNKQFKQVRILVALFLGVLVSVAVRYDNLALAVAAVVAGIGVLWVVKRRLSEVGVDERIIAVSEKAARNTYLTSSVLVACLTLGLYFWGESQEAQLLATAFSYLLLGIMALYSVFFWYFNRKSGGSPDEE